jgi:hypothetical protein
VGTDRLIGAKRIGPCGDGPEHGVFAALASRYDWPTFTTVLDSFCFRPEISTHGLRDCWPEADGRLQDLQGLWLLTCTRLGVLRGSTPPRSMSLPSY